MKEELEENFESSELPGKHTILGNTPYIYQLIIKKQFYH